MSAVIGGTASVLGGGKFANGAVTGAFGYLYNDYVHRKGHEYEFKRYICDTSASGCTPGITFEGLLRSDYPGQPPGTVVQNHGRYNVFGISSGPITVIVDYDRLTTTNITGSTHIFCCGYVTQSVIVDQTSIYIHTYGSGNNPNIFKATFNYVAGYLSFQPNTVRIREYVKP